MVGVEVDAMMMHASSIPLDSWVLLLLTDVAVAITCVAQVLQGLPQTTWHDGSQKENKTLYFWFMSYRMT